MPGLESQLQLVPKSRLNDLVPIPENAKKGAVLILLYEDNLQLMLAFIERTNDGGIHSGQISFPGGKYDKTDKDLVYTALREASEEVGINTKNVSVLGNLSTMYIPVSNYTVSPTVGFHPGKPNFILNPNEVASLIEIPLKHILDENNKGLGIVDVRGVEYEVPLYKAGKHQIWGATAMILSEFVQVLKNINGEL